MIIGIGIDTVEIEGFTTWKSYSDKKLARIFSPQEIAYARSCPAKTAERLAARFAAKEAFFKAITGIMNKPTIPFLRFCSLVWVQHSSNGRSFLCVDWDKLGITSTQPTLTVHLSISHTNSVAIASVIVEN